MTSLDVLLVTKNRISPEFEEMIKSAIPVHDIIIETSAPLGPARERAIQRAQTERFVWLDDDVFLPVNWYDTVIKYWNREKIGWLEGLAIPSAPSWYSDWSHWRFRGDIKKKTVWNLKPDERSFNCCAIVKTGALSDWHYPKGPYLGFGSEDLLMSSHVTNKGYDRVRVAIEAEHRLVYGNDFWRHVKSGIGGLAGVPQYRNSKTAIRLSLTCIGSGVKASFGTGNLAIIPNAVRWGWYWWRGLGGL